MSAGNPEPSDLDRLLAHAARADGAARARLATAVTDLFLPDHGRLSEAQRVDMTALLAKLVATIEDELRQRLIAALADHAIPAALAGLGAARVAIAAPLLDRAGLLREPELVTTLLRRSDEHRLVAALRLWSTRASEHEPDAEPALLDTLLGHDDASVAAAAMALLVAESRRFDRFQDPVMARTELGADVHRRLVWRVAAALREHLVRRERIDEARVDAAMVACAREALTAHDAIDTLEARATALALRLDRIGQLSDRMIAQSAAEGRIALAVAGIAIRAEIDFASTWDAVTDADGGRLVILLRAIGMQRGGAVRLLLLLSEAQGTGDDTLLERQVDALDALDGARARDAVRPWRLDPDYRRAQSELAGALETRELAA